MRRDERLYARNLGAWSSLLFIPAACIVFFEQKGGFRLSVQKLLSIFVPEKSALCVCFVLVLDGCFTAVCRLLCVMQPSWGCLSSAPACLVGMLCALSFFWKLASPYSFPCRNE